MVLSWSDVLPAPGLRLCDVAAGCRQDRRCAAEWDEAAALRYQGRHVAAGRCWLRVAYRVMRIAGREVARCYYNRPEGVCSMRLGEAYAEALSYLIVTDTALAAVQCPEGRMVVFEAAALLARVYRRSLASLPLAALDGAWPTPHVEQRRRSSALASLPPARSEDDDDDDDDGGASSSSSSGSASSSSTGADDDGDDRVTVLSPALEVLALYADWLAARGKQWFRASLNRQDAAVTPPLRASHAPGKSPRGRPPVPKKPPAPASPPALFAGAEDLPAAAVGGGFAVAPVLAAALQAGGVERAHMAVGGKEHGVRYLRARYGVTPGPSGEGWVGFPAPAAAIPADLRATPDELAAAKARPALTSILKRKGPPPSAPPRQVRVSPPPDAEPSLVAATCASGDTDDEAPTAAGAAAPSDPVPAAREAALALLAAAAAPPAVEADPGPRTAEPAGEVVPEAPYMNAGAAPAGAALPPGQRAARPPGAIAAPPVLSGPPAAPRRMPLARFAQSMGAAAELAARARFFWRWRRWAAGATAVHGGAQRLQAVRGAEAAAREAVLGDEAAARECVATQEALFVAMQRVVSRHCRDPDHAAAYLASSPGLPTEFSPRRAPHAAAPTPGPARHPHRTPPSEPPAFPSCHPTPPGPCAGVQMMPAVAAPVAAAANPLVPLRHEAAPHPHVASPPYSYPHAAPPPPASLYAAPPPGYVPAPPTMWWSPYGASWQEAPHHTPLLYRGTHGYAASAGGVTPPRGGGAAATAGGGGGLLAGLAQPLVEQETVARIMTVTGESRARKLLAHAAQSLAAPGAGKALARLHRGAAVAC
eukprot:TRINITY_DN4659_c0_g1_i1.p1 TRINITY_DN4659_c0_g1~~TRINITY_DN4659_c0_g1_i1.p1  ORF type:complete len:820 (+),score=189.77 TRINITY_DN4659_c0_g1_i1:120-2579(+)